MRQNGTLQTLRIWLLSRILLKELGYCALRSMLRRLAWEVTSYGRRIHVEGIGGVHAVVSLSTDDQDRTPTAVVPPQEA